MKKIFKALAMCGFLAATSVASYAQNTNSGYFLDEYTYRYQLNPAFGNDKGFVAMPGIGNLNIAMRGNLHLKNVFYNIDGRTCLFTNPGVSVAEAMKGFHDKNRLSFDTRINILSFGFKAFKGYNTVSLGVRASASLHAPKAFFELAKEGITNKTYDIKNLSARGLGYAELALNHSHEIKAVPGLRVGASMKFLLGAGYADAYFNRAELTLGENEWTAVTNADIYASVPRLRLETKVNDRNQEYVSGCEFEDSGSLFPQGFGMAFDFGASYKWKDFNFSLALLDLGWISFKDTKFASTDGDRTVNTDAYIFNPDDNAENSFDNEWNDLVDNLEDLYQLSDHGNIGTRKRSLGATLNVGVDYEFPMYRKLHFGFLSSTRIDGRYSWSEARFSANVAPVKLFSADANVAFGSYGASFGWMANLHLTGFNLFLGMDHTLGKLAKQYVPLSSNASVNFGLNFLF